jgi:hypothetical protein
VGRLKDRREAVFLFHAGHFANARYWHLADIPTAPAFVRYWSNSGHCIPTQAAMEPVIEAM